ncbi:DEAD/DEAH box helicase [Halioxenophilus sp. WMMB6]|uniref:DEAD/DEAH box helicase n=1 Tax=Halioxenophilus sp. WMMB6 TaxID=3073815 RepID=UPI00295EBC96|nr:DEAD/DEAH box helicase [Halioxenophilus sp. WMMB6]
MQFSDLGLRRELLDAVSAQGYTTPSPIQAQAIPAVLEGHDVMGAAQTGTGKTAGFTLPILQRLSQGTPAKANQARALVLTPTRELAAQVGDSVSRYGKQLPLRSTVVFGGVGINPQMMALRRGVDILVATPGRLLDLYNQNAVRFEHLEILVLDEADRMLDMGFIHDIKRVLKLLPAKRQNLLFSATFSDDIRALAKGLVNNPVEIDVAPRNTTVERVKQTVYPVNKGDKPRLLIDLIQTNDWHQVLVFSRTKHGANRLVKQLDSAGLPAAAIHGNKSQGARTKALADFKENKIQVLVATDIAARGIDISQLPHVINFDLPNVQEDYVHRIGRTGRAGASGEALSLVAEEDADLLFAIERFTQQIIPREIHERFPPSFTLPESKLKASQNRKPKKPKSEQPNGNRQAKANANGQPRSGAARQTENRGDAPANRNRRRRPRRKPAAVRDGA